MLSGSPGFTVCALAEQLACGAFFGRSFTVKFAWQLAISFFFSLLTRAEAVYAPGTAPVVSICTEAPWPPTLPPLVVQSYFKVRFAGKLAALAVAVTGSPGKTSLGCAAQVALGGTGGGP